MSFINEFVAEEDARKYGLDELKAKLDPWIWRDGRPSTFQHSWTIDRESGVFLMQAHALEQIGASGRLQPTLQKLYVLDIGGQRAQFVLEGHWTSTQEKPVPIRWHLVSDDLSEIRNMSREVVLDYLRSALSAYGLMGVYMQEQKTAVEFDF